MGEPESEPGGQPGTLDARCEPSETPPDGVNRDIDEPLSPNSAAEVPLPETEPEDKGTVSLAGEVDAIAEKAASGEEHEEVGGAVAGDGNPPVKEEEEAEAQEVRTVECSMQPEAFHEAVVAGTEEVLKEESPQIDHAVRNEEVHDQIEAPVKDEVRSAVKAGSLSEEANVAEVAMAGNDDMTKEEEEIEQKVELVGEAENKEEEITETEAAAPNTNNEEVDGLQSEDKNLTQDEEPKMDESMHDHTTDKDAPTEKDAPHTETDQETVQSERNNEGADGLQSEHKNLTRDEETSMDELMHDDHGSGKTTDDDDLMVPDGDGDKGMDEDEDLTGDGEEVKGMDEDEDLTRDGDGAKGMDEDEDLTRDGDQDGGEDGDKAIDEAAMGMDDDATDDQAAEHGDEGLGTNDGEDDEEDDPPPLPAKKSSGGRRKRARSTRIKRGEEELCFICFDGGELVVCDRRSDY